MHCPLLKNYLIFYEWKLIPLYLIKKTFPANFIFHCNLGFRSTGTIILNTFPVNLSKLKEIEKLRLVIIIRSERMAGWKLMFSFSFLFDLFSSLVFYTEFYLHLNWFKLLYCLFSLWLHQEPIPSMLLEEYY